MEWLPSRLEDTIAKVLASGLLVLEECQGPILTIAHAHSDTNTAEEALL